MMVKPATSGTLTPRLVQMSPQYSGSTTTITITLPASCAQGNQIGVLVWARSNDANEITSVTCTSESNLAVSSVVGNDSSSTYSVYFAYLGNVTTAGSKTIVITTGTSLGAQMWAVAYEIKGSRPLTTATEVKDYDNDSGAGGDSMSLTTNDDDAITVGAVLTADPGAIPFPTASTPYRNLTQFGITGGDAGLFYADATDTAGSKTLAWTHTGTLEWAGLIIEHGIDNSINGTGVFSNMSASGGPSASGVVAFPNTVGAGAGPPYGFVSMESMTASGGPAASGAVSFVAMSARQTVSGGATFVAMTEEAFARSGATGVAAFLELTATGDASGPVVASGEMSFPPMSAFGYVPHSGAVEFEVMFAEGVARGPALGAVSFEPMAIVWAAGHPRFEAMQAYGTSSEGLQETYDTKAMNTKLGAVTEFTNYKFNSFARIGKDFYGVGPTGLHRLDGATDAGTEINWSLRTGRHDDRKPVIKRVPQIFLGLRSNGNVTVRVWSDDNTSNDYPLPKVQTNTIHQHRVVPGKGLQSRYFGVELRGTKNATLELDSMQVDMKELGTRIG
jgi:hypothetical protein